MNTLSVKTTSEPETGEKSFLSERTRNVIATLEEVDLKKEFHKALIATRELFEIGDDENSSIEIKEIKVSFEISASGEVRLIGSAGVETTGAIEVTLCKKEPLK